MALKLVIDWGARSRALQGRLGPRHRVSGPSFWLSPTKPPVALGSIKLTDLPKFETAVAVDIPLTAGKTPLTVEGIVPTGVSHVRLDFDLKATVSGTTTSVLAFRQVFAVGSQALMPVGSAVEDYVFEASPSGPVRKKGASMTGFRRYLWAHPLVATTPSRVTINAEFVDATELWWAIRKDDWGWYLNSALGGRHEHLRVLAWTGGGAPMLWFAVIPDAAVTTLEAASKDAKPASTGVAAQKSPSSPPADIVFFRPPPGANSFPYKATADGFADKRHDDTTLHILARYLLSPRPIDQLKGLTGVKGAVDLADQIQPTSTKPTTPVDPMTIAMVLWTAFRPVGLEAALNRVAVPHVLLLPLGFDAAQTKEGEPRDPGGYEGAFGPDVKATVRSALFVLWNNGAIARELETAPSVGDRQLWLVGHSAGNLGMWSCLEKNQADVDRVISLDAAPKSLNFASGIRTITNAVKVRAKQKKTVEAFFIVTPHLTGHKEGLDDATDRELRGTKASVTVLPDFSERTDYWKLPPTAATNPYLLNLLSKWTPKELQASADKGLGNWRFLFLHELAAFGGHLEPAPGTKAQRVRTFFQDALGPPSPRPPLP